MVESIRSTRGAGDRRRRLVRVLTPRGKASSVRRSARASERARSSRRSLDDLQSSGGRTGLLSRAWSIAFGPAGLQATRQRSNGGDRWRGSDRPLLPRRFRCILHQSPRRPGWLVDGRQWRSGRARQGVVPRRTREIVDGAPGACGWRCWETRLSGPLPHPQRTTARRDWLIAHLPRTSPPLRPNCSRRRCRAADRGRSSASASTSA